jgi:hypothetical protein
MDLVSASATIISLIIFLIIFLSLIKEIKSKSLERKEIPLVIIAISYLLLAMTLILRQTNSISLNPTDFLSIFSIVLTAKAIALLIILTEIREDKKVLYNLIPFAFLIPLIAISPKNIHMLIPVSLFAILLSFLQTTSIHKNPTRYLIIYISASLFTYLLAIYIPELTQILMTASVLLFIPFTFSFLKFLNKNQKLKRRYTRKEAESPIIYMLKHLIFIIIITNFVFIGTVSIHELGHLGASAISKCEGSRIVYELEGLPHTEIDCELKNGKSIWILGGLLLPIIFASFLIVGGGKFIREIAIQIIGFNLIISYMDTKALGSTEAISMFIVLIGVALVALSIGLLAKSRVE